MFSKGEKSIYPINIVWELIKTEFYEVANFLKKIAKRFDFQLLLLIENVIGFDCVRKKALKKRVELKVLHAFKLRIHDFL